MTIAKGPWTTLAVRAGAVVLCLGLAWFYVAAATEHGRRVNVSKARGDQSGYLGDAERVYANWHGRRPPLLIGERNRMPLYAGYLALFYYDGLSDPDYFEVAKRANIYLSLALIVVSGLVWANYLPSLLAINLTGIVAFGVFVYKAGYSQSELLFYFLFVMTFLGCWRLLLGLSPRRTWVTAATTGVFAGLAHLTKAAMLPFVAIFLACYAGSAILRLRRRDDHAAGSAALRTLLASAVLGLTFLAVLTPYLLNSQRTYGHYFYNVNSTFYVWYDDWAHASLGTYSHGDGLGWPTLPESELPGASRYWREHSLTTIGARIVSGFRDMAIQPYSAFGFLPYVVLYAAALGFVLLTRWSAVRRLVAQHRALAIFLLLYAGVYLLAIAFYYPTSGTGTGRFLLAHVAPFFFAVSALFGSSTLWRTRWLLFGRGVGLPHFAALVTTILAADVGFHVWPRLMSTYGGF